MNSKNTSLPTPPSITIKDDVADTEFIELTTEEDPENHIRNAMLIMVNDQDDMFSVFLCKPSKMRHMAEWLNETANWIEEFYPNKKTNP